MFLILTEKDFEDFYGQSYDQKERERLVKTYADGKMSFDDAYQAMLDMDIHADRASDELIEAKDRQDIYNRYAKEVNEIVNRWFDFGFFPTGAFNEIMKVVMKGRF